MGLLRVILGLASLSTLAHTLQLPSIKRDDGDATLSLEPQLTGGFELVLTEGDERNVLGVIGRTLSSVFASETIEDGVEIQVSGVNLTVTLLYDEEASASGIRLRWVADHDIRLEDCYDFGSKHWYGGAMQEEQIYPIENAQLSYASYVSRESDNGAIMERYWVNSAGQYIYVDPEVPLFVDYNNLSNNHVCFGAQIAAPYSSKREHVVLSYQIWMLSDVKKAHQHAVDNYLGKPDGLPDFRMVQHPIWSTWAQFSRNINEENLITFANEIVDNGFNNSQFEIDDEWEFCYGSLTVNENKFSNFSGLVQQLKSMGFRVTLWIHPFINKDCDPWYSEALNNGYLVLNEEGSPDTSWWNNNGSIGSYVDFTNKAAAQWWAERVALLRDTYDIDSFKFDAGESSFSPQIPVQEGDIDLHPHHIVRSYVETCAQFGDMIEVRAGFRTQNLPVFVRLVDRDSTWGLNNGLSTVITSALLASLAGYTLVLPDMIGGNGFNLEHPQSSLPTKELFIRWVQANTFLPAMQYSYVPWNFDEETVNISKKYTDLHAAYAEEIYAALNSSVVTGRPAVAPLWWKAPEDQEALVIWDEYLIGERILVAPVVVEGATSRDIYLPEGTWFEEGDPERAFEGPLWLRDHSASLDYLPYFVLDDSATDSAFQSCVSIVLIFLGVFSCILVRMN